MTTFEDLFKIQETTGETIFTVVRNFKKDSASRKQSSQYFVERIERLKGLVNQFKSTDATIRSLPDPPYDHDYFVKSYYTEVMAVATKYQAEFETGLLTVRQESAEGARGHDVVKKTSSTIIVGLLRRQAASLAALRRMCERLKADMSEHPPQYYQYKSDTLHHMWQQSEALHLNIFESCEDPVSEGYDEATYNDTEDQVHQALVDLSLKGHKDPSSTSVGDKSALLNLACSVQLPRVDIPKFNGDYLKWNQFYDLFTQMVHNQPLPTIQKMWYLKMNLSGEAEALVHHLNLSEENYDTAWMMLKDRYNNVRILTYTLIQKLLDQPGSTSSATSIKSLHDTTQECLLALNNIGVITTNWDPILLYMLFKKMDKATYMAFEQSLTNPRDLPTMTEFLGFLEKRFQSLESYTHKEKSSPTLTTAKHCTLGAAIRPGAVACKACKSGTHRLFACQAFLKLQPMERINLVKKENLCINCLKAGHKAEKCISRHCIKCNKKHNSLLHLPVNDGKKKTEESMSATLALKPQNSLESAALAASNKQKLQSYVLLGTAMIKLIANNGKEIEGRAILDSGSQINIVTERLVKRLGIKSTKTCMLIQGIGQGNRKADQRINVNMQSRHNKFSTRLEAFVLPRIISQQPSQAISTAEWPIPDNINLADPRFNYPGTIDVLLGAEFYNQLLLIGQISLGANLPTLQNTVFGWILSGKIEAHPHAMKKIDAVKCGICTGEEDNLDEKIERLWKLEEVAPSKQKLSKADDQCEQQFVQNISRTTNGRFIVKLPFADSPRELGESESIAYNRFLALERKLSKNEDLRKQYTTFMKEYEALGHMRKISRESILTPNYFVPHHCVIKPDSSTTKLRVVFDASAKCSSGVSLNDILHTGPTIQDDLFSILLRFRLPRFVFTTDIKKMYRQIFIHEEDRRYQMIFWRNSSNEPLQIYELNTVTYGTRPAPYLAIRCIRQLIKENKYKYPLGCEFLENNFYVDDGLGGADSLSAAIETQQQLLRVLESAKFSLHKWSANHSQLLQNIPENIQEKNLDLSQENHGAINTLGLTWLPREDKFCIKVNLCSHKRITKRSVSSDLARLFDPLGILSPIIVTAKIFIQELWSLKLSWDESLSVEQQTRWTCFREGLLQISNFKISRHIHNGGVSTSIQIHAFSDASEKAFGAAIYLRSICTNGRVIVRLLCAKSRVAPLKRQTLPRLELCAALLSVQLVTRIKNDLKLCDVPTFFWTDSTIVLSWLNSSSVSYQTFVANRIASIQELSIMEQWRHVTSHNNPADVLSRGMSPKKLAECSLWFYGPVFLHGAESQWPPKFTPTLYIADDTERKRMPKTVNHDTGRKRKAPVSFLIDADTSSLLYSINHKNSFTALQRITAYVIRFVKRLKGISTPNQIQLTPQELDGSMKLIVRTVQQSDFRDEIKSLTKGDQVRKSSSMISLSPFLDDEGIIRVGGRLTSSTLSYDAKHPMLLPYNDPIVKLLLQMIHIRHLHCGPQLLLAHVRQKFWPIKGKIMTRSVVQHCVKCSRSKPLLLNQIMGNLPHERIQPARPFINSGVDYCGPFEVHYKIRGKRPHKAYIAIFCCFVTKAVHLELVADLTTAAFIGALKRFIGRRGHCQNLFCDNATNFVGASNELQKQLNSSEAQESIIMACSTKGITFHFIPPRSPHFGGLWESAVKSAKYLLTRSVSTASLTYEELETVVVEIEAILNSRPLTEMSTDPNDLTAITPGHFLIGESLTSQVDPSAKAISTSLPTSWKLVTHLKFEFWKRWSVEYLNQLQQRAKWTQHSPNIKIGSMVIVKEDNLPPLKWPLGRVIKTYAGNDGFVRVAKIKTSTGEWKRPIHRLAPLPVNIEIPQIPTESLIEAEDIMKETPIPKRRKATNVLTTLLCLVFLLPLVLSDPITITKYNTTPGIHFEGLGIVKLITAEWNIVAFFDLVPLQTSVNTFINGTIAMHNICQQMENHISCDMLAKQFQQDSDHLKSSNKIMMHNRKKRGAIDVIGNIANTLFGVLDSKYAEQVTRTISRINENESHLLTLINNQTSIIDSTINLIKQDHKAIAAKFKELDNQIQQLGTLTNKQQSLIVNQAQYQFFTTLAIQLSLMKNHIEQTQAAILDILTDTNHGRIHPLLLSPTQLTTEIAKIKSQLPSTLQLPVDQENLISLYKLLKITAGCSEDHLIFNIQLPLNDDRVFNLFNLIPIPRLIQNKIKIPKLATQYLAISPHRDIYFPSNDTLIKSCVVISQSTYLCTDVKTVYNQGSGVCTCEVEMFNNETNTNCMLTEFTNDLLWQPMLKTNEWIFAAKTPIRVNAVCDADVLQVTLNGTGKIKLQANCVIKTKQMTAHSHQQMTNNITMSYVSLNEVIQVEPTTNINRVNINVTHFVSKIDELTQLQTQLKAHSNLDLPHDLTLTDRHQFVVGYLALFISIVIVSTICWKWISKMRRKASGPASPTPRPRQGQSFEVTID